MLPQMQNRAERDVTSSQPCAFTSRRDFEENHINCENASLRNEDWLHEHSNRTLGLNMPNEIDARYLGFASWPTFTHIQTRLH